MSDTPEEWIKLLDDDLVRDEGKRSHPYVDTAGKISVGIGRNLTDRGLRDSEIVFLYENDRNEAITELDRVLPSWRSVPDSVKRALVNMMFNLGAPRFLGFEKMIEALRQNRYGGAALEAVNSKWAEQVGQRAWRIADLIRKGDV